MYGKRRIFVQKLMMHSCWIKYVQSVSTGGCYQMTSDGVLLDTMVMVRNTYLQQFKFILNRFTTCLTAVVGG